MSDYPVFRAVARTLYPEIRETTTSDEYSCASTRRKITHLKDCSKVTLEREAKTLTQTRRNGEIVDEIKSLGKYTMTIIFKEDHTVVHFPAKLNTYTIYAFYYYDPNFDASLIELVREYLASRRLNLDGYIQYVVDVP